VAKAAKAFDLSVAQKRNPWRVSLRPIPYPRNAPGKPHSWHL